MANTLLAQAQNACYDADEAFYSCQWEVALEKCSIAARICKQALSDTHEDKNREVVQTLNMLCTRYTEMAQQIEEYLESSNSMMVSGEFNGTSSSSSPQLTGNAFLHDEPFEDSYSPYIHYGSLMYDSDLTASVDSDEESGSLGVIWKGVEQLLNLLPSPRTVKGLLPRMNRPLTEHVSASPLSNDLLDSFVLVPKQELPANQNNPATAPSPSKVPSKPSTSSACADHLAEIEKLRAENAALKQQNEKFQRMHTVRNGVQELLQENTILKKSINNFRYQFQKQSQLWRMNSQALSSTRTPTSFGVPTFSQLAPTPEDLTPSTLNSLVGQPLNRNTHEQKRVQELEVTVRNLQATISAQEQEIQELTKYKKRYKEAIVEARKKQQEKKSQSDSISISNSSMSSMTS